jgi:guanylate kinase
LYNWQMQFTSQSFPILIIIGPSGSGKSTLIRQLNKRQIVQVVPTWTTRPPRPDEKIEAIEHKFVTESEFQAAKAKGTFLSTLQMFDLPYWYGAPKIPRPTRKHVPAIILRASLIDTFSQYYSNYIIYEIEDTLPRIKKRLLKRGLHGEAMGSRLSDYHKEIALGRTLAQRTFINSDDTKILLTQLDQAITEDFRNLQ